MSKKPYRINGKDVVVKAENTLYTNNGMAGVADAKGALDNLNDRVGELEENGGGGSSIVVEGSASVTDTNSVPQNIKRVFYKDDYVGKSSNWDIQLLQFMTDENVSIAASAPFTLTIEVSASGTTIGNGGITAKSINLQGQSNFNAATLSYIKDDVKETFKYTGFWSTSTYAGTKKELDGYVVISAAGATSGIKVTAYVDTAGKRFYCKRCIYSADSNASSANNVALPYYMEWPLSCVTPNKAEAIASDIIRIGGFGSDEYNPFITPTTTPRVICTICSDDGEVRDYTILRPYFQQKAEDAGVPIRWSIAVIPALTKWRQSSIPYGTGNMFMTAEMIRDLASNYGVSVLCHNYNHELLNQDPSLATEEAQYNLFVKAKNFIERRIGVQCIHHCLPGGGFNENTWAALNRVFIDTATTNAGINTAATNFRRIYRNDVYGMTSEQLTQKLADALDYVQQNNKSAWVCYYTHGHELNIHMPKIRAITEYCITNGIAMRNYSEAYAEIYPPLARLKALLGIS